MDSALAAVAKQFKRVRARTLELCEPLEIEDYGVQPMVDASPPKWHLAHTTWFFETFILKPAVARYQPFNPSFEYLFNSYYEGVGDRHPRPERGLLSRPTVREVLDYRSHVDDAIEKLLVGLNDPDLLKRITLGAHHEQQHQELILTDLKYNLGHNPLRPVYRKCARPADCLVSSELNYLNFQAGLCAIGATNHSEDFCFDNELPRHTTYIHEFKLANRLVTNAEYVEFMADGGYEKPDLWMSDGWAEKRQREWRAPEYWHLEDGEWIEYTLHGDLPINPQAPVCHVSYFEADAFARWAGSRLATEFEWEIAATQTETLNGSFADEGYFHPVPQQAALCGDCWQWTSSSYAAYPGFQPLAGTLGEYNGKFMANQYVLRGGSCATPFDHFRHTYRNFFDPKDRWQFSGIRLAKSVDV